MAYLDLRVFSTFRICSLTPLEPNLTAVAEKKIKIVTLNSVELFQWLTKNYNFFNGQQRIPSSCFAFHGNLPAAMELSDSKTAGAASWAWASCGQWLTDRWLILSCTSRLAPSYPQPAQGKRRAATLPRAHNGALHLKGLFSSRFRSSHLQFSTHTS